MSTQNLVYELERETEISELEVNGNSPILILFLPSLLEIMPTKQLNAIKMAVS